MATGKRKRGIYHQTHRHEERGSRFAGKGGRFATAAYQSRYTTLSTSHTHPCTGFVLFRSAAKTRIHSTILLFGHYRRVLLLFLRDRNCAPPGRPISFTKSGGHPAPATLPRGSVPRLSHTHTHTHRARKWPQIDGLRDRRKAPHPRHRAVAMLRYRWTHTSARHFVRSVMFVQQPLSLYISRFLSPPLSPSRVAVSHQQEQPLSTESLVSMKRSG